MRFPPGRTGQKKKKDPRSRKPEAQEQTFDKSSGEALEKIRRANKVRWKESANMAKVERKLTKKLKEDLGQRPGFP